MSERRILLRHFEEQKEFYEQKVSEGIEKYRKGDAVITLVDKDGKTISGAKVKAIHKKHEFKFGANIFMLDELETEEKNEKYKKYFSEVFNMATLPFYWDTLEPVKGKPRYSKDSEKIYRRPTIDLCIEFCEKHGIEPREHALAYDHFFPKWLYNASVDEIKQELERRYSEISERYADKIPTIEVTNEMEWIKGMTAFYDEPDFVEWCFKLAEKYFPNNELVINEHTALPWGDRCRATDKYYSYIEANMLKGARIDAIGMQYHLFFPKEDIESPTKLLNPQSLYRHMDLYSNFNKPLQVTEITIPVFSWEKEDEEVQADILEKLYSVWFSHPNMEQIVYWNLVDGYAHHWDPDPAKIRATQGVMTIGENRYYGGLIRFDLTPKPAYYRLKELLTKRWHTEVELVSDCDGKVAFRGFYGQYDVEIEVNGETKRLLVDLSSKSDNVIEILV